MGRTNRMRTGLVMLSWMLATAGLAASPAPAVAVHTVPWRFTTVTVNSSISGWNGAEPIKGWVLQCPAGYTAVSGGIVGGDATDGVWRLLEYPDPNDGTFHIMARNGAASGTTIILAATCVWLDDVGTITIVNATFARNGNGRAGGTLYCPAGTTVLSAGTDWSNFSNGRSIDYSAPVTDGTQYGLGWYVAGYSDVAGVLGIELRCVDSALLTAEYAEADDSAAGPGERFATAACAAGFRLLTGGAGPAVGRNPGVDQGRTSLSGPVSYSQWPVRSYMPSGVILRSLALCVPASTVSVSYTVHPAALSTASSGSIVFTAADSAGETVTVSCFLDGAARSCASGFTIPYGPLLDGDHAFQVIAKNKSGFVDSSEFDWKIDATVPTISGHGPMSAGSLTGAYTINFSEPVDGVTTSSVTVHAESANVNVSGKVGRPNSTTATWTPNARLVPGETYRFSFSSAIHDTAGNPLTTTFFTVRTVTTVDSTSTALERYWDLDNSAIASGGAYIVSRLAGTQANLSFTATAGQTVSLYGIRVARGGYADVYLDGVKKATASFYAATTARARVYLSAALSAGTHTISIRPLGTKPAGSSGTAVPVDDVEIGATVKQESSLIQTFRRDSAASAWGGSYDVINHVTDGDTTPPRFRLTFVGTGVKVYVTKTSPSGTARVYVDNVLKATVNLHSASTVYGALVYSGTVALGVHTVRIEAVGTSTGTNSSI